MSQRLEPVSFGKFGGLRNAVTEERLGPEDLATATNLDLDDAGQGRRRRGATLVAAGDYHSLYRNGTDTFVVKNGTLSLLRPDYTDTALLAGVGADKLAYCSVGSDTYFASRVVSGYVRNGAVYPWGQLVSAGVWESPVRVPTDYLAAVGGILVGPPPHATSITEHNGRIYLANENLLWATELFRFTTVDKTRNYFQFEDPITAVFSAEDGLYVGTTTAVYFLSGQFRTMKRTQVHGFGLIPGSVAPAPVEALSDDGTYRRGASKTAHFMLTSSGLCVALDSGVCYVLTEGRFEFPTAQEAAAMFRKQDGFSQYVGVTTNAGTPTSKARFGDHIDAEIIRFGA